MRAHSVLPLLLLGLVSCHAIPPHELNELYRVEITQRETQYRIKPGDSISIRIFNPTPGQPGVSLDQTLGVLPDGRTDPFFLDNLIVGGKTIVELQTEIAAAYAAQINQPEVSVQITPADEFVYIVGEVRTPGQQTITNRTTLSQAMARAGGYRVTASADEVLLIRPFRDHRRPDRFVIDLYDFSEDVVLLPDDQIIVDPTTWILIREYMREYIWGLLPPLLPTLLGAGI
jgi:protein involved in polysaccharide export with SLBB domain